MSYARIRREQQLFLEVAYTGVIEKIRIGNWKKRGQKREGGRIILDELEPDSWKTYFRYVSLTYLLQANEIIDLHVVKLKDYAAFLIFQSLLLGIIVSRSPGERPYACY